MSTIKLTDELNVEIDAELKEDSAIAKYIKDLKRLRFSELKFDELKNSTLDKVPVKSIKSGINFEHPVDVGASGIKLKIGAGVSGELRLYSADDKQLFDPELFGDPIQINAGQYYLGLTTTATVSAGLNAETGDLSFGLNAGTQASLSSYRLFQNGGGAGLPLFSDALKQAIAGFTILGDLEDIAAMEVGAVAAANGAGNLKFSAGFNLLSITNPLAMLDLPSPLGEAKVTAGSAIKIGASVEISGAYQIRVQKTGKNTFHLGVYKKRATDLNIKVSASSGLSATVGKTDLLEKILQAISADPQLDKDVLLHGGLTEAQIAAIKKALEAGISRKLEIALNFEFDQLKSSDAAFLYDVAIDKLDEAGRLAIHRALDGNLSELADETALPSGIGLVRSILTEIHTKKHALKFNLLGIYNFSSLSTLILKGTVMFDSTTGELVITDKVTGTKIAASTLNFAADTEKLRRVMMNSVLITAVYRGSKLVIGNPTLSLLHDYFELHGDTNHTKMKNNLEVLEALGLINAAQTQAFLQLALKFGRTTLFAETAYGDAEIRKLFFNAGTLRSQDEYETAGRTAIALTVRPGEVDDTRRLPATDNALWASMRAATDQALLTDVAALKPLAGPRLQAIISDYRDITWWAASMRGMGEKIAAVDTFFAANPSPDPNSNSFKVLREDFAKSIRKVVENAREQFGDPWGLIAMDQISGRSATAKAMITGPVFSLSKNR